jgi:uncharacterized repeat protein (TIGR01451 family)
VLQRKFAVVVLILAGLLTLGHRATAQGGVTEPVPMVSAGPETPPLKLEIIGPAQSIFGTPLEYVIVIRNTGSSPAAQVHVEDRLSADAAFVRSQPPADVHADRLAWDLGALAPGTERRLTVVLQPTRQGEFVSAATVTCAATSRFQTQIAEPRLMLRVTGPESVRSGESAMFQLQVTNKGATPIQNVVVRDRLPTGLRHPQGGFIETSLGMLAPAETKRLTLPVLAVQAGHYENEASASAGEGVQASVRTPVRVTEPGTQASDLNGKPAPQPLEGGATDASRSLPQTRGLQTIPDSRGSQTVQAQEPPTRSEKPTVAELQLEVVDQDDPIEVGAETAYEIRVRNRGAGLSTGIRIMATVPTGMVITGASGPTAYRIQAPHVLFQPLARLASGAEATYQVRVRGQQVGDWRFKVQLTTDQGGRPLQEEQSTRVYGN